MSPYTFRDRPGAAFRLLALSFKIAISLLIIFSFLPFATGGFRVDLPGASSFNWSFQDGQFVFAGPVTICNGGVYDISDVTVTYQIDNSTSYRLTDKTVEWGTLSAGSEVTRMLVFSIDYNRLTAESDWMLFHPDSLSLNVIFSATYTLGLVAFSIGSHLALQWNGPVLSTQSESGGASHSSGPGEINVPGSNSSSAVTSPIGTASADWPIDLNERAAPIQPSGVYLQQYASGGYRGVSGWPMN